MKWSCSTVRRRLSEYHDGELTIDQRVAIQEHLRACVGCEAEAHALVAVGSQLRAAAAQRVFTDGSESLDGLAAGVISRLHAERDESLSHAVQRMFEDLHLVWAALGATAATFACLAITVGIFYFSRPGTNGNPMRVDDETAILLPRQEVPRAGARYVPELLTDEEIMLDTTITREGRVDMARLELMEPDGPTAGEPEQTDWKSVGSVLDSVAQARFEPARKGGEPVAVKVFWFVTHTTVRPKAPGQVHRHSGAGVTHTA